MSQSAAHCVGARSINYVSESKRTIRQVDRNCVQTQRRTDAELVTRRLLGSKRVEWPVHSANRIEHQMAMFYCPDPLCNRIRWEGVRTLRILSVLEAREVLTDRYATLSFLGRVVSHCCKNYENFKLISSLHQYVRATVGLQSYLSWCLLKRFFMALHVHVSALVSSE